MCTFLGDFGMFLFQERLLIQAQMRRENADYWSTHQVRAHHPPCFGSRSGCCCGTAMESSGTLHAAHTEEELNEAVCFDDAAPLHVASQPSVTSDMETNWLNIQFPFSRNFAAGSARKLRTWRISQDEFGSSRTHTHLQV